MHRPHFNGLVVRGCDQGLAITGEAHAADCASVCAEGGRLTLPKWGAIITNNDDYTDNDQHPG